MRYARVAPVAATAAVAAVLAGGCAAMSTHQQASAQSCARRYQEWQDSAATKAFKRDGTALTAAFQVQDEQRVLKLMRAVGPAATAMGPAPRCADPAGYSRKLIGQFQAMARGAAAPGGEVPELRAALAPMTPAKNLGTELSKELARTVPGSQASPAS
jgi:hypothetical protein